MMASLIGDNFDSHIEDNKYSLNGDLVSGFVSRAMFGSFCGFSLRDSSLSTRV